MTFRETRRATGVQIGTIALGVAVAGGMLASALPAAHSTAERVALVVVALATVGLAAAVARMASMVVVDPAEGMLLRLSTGVPVWRRRIGWHELADVTRVPLSVARAGGLGLRFLGPGRWALLVRPGAVVALRVTGPRPAEYLVATDRPTELLTALESHRRRTAGS